MESELGHQTLTNMFTNNETLKQSPIYQPLGMQDEDYPSNFIIKRKHLLVGNITHVFFLQEFEKSLTMHLPPNRITKLILGVMSYWQYILKQYMYYS